MCQRAISTICNAIYIVNIDSNLRAWDKEISMKDWHLAYKSFQSLEKSNRMSLLRFLM